MSSQLESHFETSSLVGLLNHMPPLPDSQLGEAEAHFILYSIWCPALKPAKRWWGLDGSSGQKQ